MGQENTRTTEGSYETLLFEIFVSLAVIDVTLLVLELLHGLLLEYLVTTFSLELLGH